VSVVHAAPDRKISDPVKGGPMSTRVDEYEENLYTLRPPAQRPEEQILYDALRRRQDGMHHLDSFSILVQPWVTIRQGQRFRPDFVVVLRSAWAIEIDGSSHSRRYAADRTRDELLYDHAIPVLRIPVQDVEDPTLCEDWVDRIIVRCRTYRAA
jgi:very-short-patch-repair endonuclease